tara:strand:- start:2773 stop:3018 length:246 start_codon:yes stop_codon:yes gene_type:complete
MRAGSDIGYCDSYENKVAMQLPTEIEIEAIINSCGVIAERVAYTLDDKLLIEFDYNGNYVSEYITLDEIDSIKEIVEELKL